MKTLFYPKLAVNGMKKNKRLYLPYILTLVAMVMMMYITAYLARSEKHRKHKQRRLRTVVSLARNNRNQHFLLDFSFLQLLCAYQKPWQRVRLIQYSRNEQTQHCTHTPLRKPFHAYHIASLRTCRRNTPVTPR